MPDSKSTPAERKRQPEFSFLAPLLLILLPVSLLAADEFLIPALQPPPRERTATVRFEPVSLPRDVAGPLHLAGAWQIESDDPDVAAISAIAAEPGALVAISDSGMALRLPKPGAGDRALLRPLPGGPGDPRFKQNRDSEALARDERGRGWWVAFERHHQLWLYDRSFRQSLRRTAVPSGRMGPNTGVEGLVAAGGALLLVPERPGDFLRLSDKGFERVPVRGARGRLSDALEMPGGSLLAIERRYTPLGFKSALLVLKGDGRGFAIAARIPLRLGPIDNPEALAAERLADGTIRLWLATDDNGQKPLRSLLLALDVPPDWPGGARGA